ncbi:MAG: hypothetical protein HQL90_10665 [Magnetococcales bacterium]|nr:hypothetical protein [Magnetococcales bacterium]
MENDVDAEIAKIKLGMKIDEDARNALKEVYEEARILPAWFVPRMMTDNWFFGLLMVSGITIGVERIEKLRRDAAGNIWLDVILLDRLMSHMAVPYKSTKTFFVAPTSRTTASINASHVMAVFELADT